MAPDNLDKMDEEIRKTTTNLFEPEKPSTVSPDAEHQVTFTPEHVGSITPESFTSTERTDPLPIDITKTSMETPPETQEVTLKMPPTEPVASTEFEGPGGPGEPTRRQKAGVFRTEGGMVTKEAKDLSEVVKNNLPPELLGQLSSTEMIRLESGALAPKFEGDIFSKDARMYNEYLDRLQNSISDQRWQLASERSKATGENVEDIFKAIVTPAGAPLTVPPDPNAKEYTWGEKGADFAYGALHGWLTRGIVPLGQAPFRLASTGLEGLESVSRTLGAPDVGEALKTVYTNLDSLVSKSDEIMVGIVGAPKTIYGSVAAEISGIIGTGIGLRYAASLITRFAAPKVIQAANLSEEAVKLATPQTLLALSKEAGISKKARIARGLMAEFKYIQDFQVPQLMDKIRKRGVVDRPDLLLEWITGSLTYSAVSAKEADDFILNSGYFEEYKGKGAFNRAMRKAIMVTGDAALGAVIYSFARVLKGTLKIADKGFKGTYSMTPEELRKYKYAFNTFLDKEIASKNAELIAMKNMQETSMLSAKTQIRDSNLANMVIDLAVKHNVDPATVLPKVKSVMDDVAMRLGKSAEDAPEAASMITRTMMQERPSWLNESLDMYTARIRAVGLGDPDETLMLPSPSITEQTAKLAKDLHDLDNEIVNNLAKQYAEADFLKPIRDLVRQSNEYNLNLLAETSYSKAIKGIYEVVDNAVKKGLITTLDEAYRETLRLAKVTRLISAAQIFDFHKVSRGLTQDFVPGEILERTRLLLKEFDIEVPDSELIYRPLANRAETNSMRIVFNPKRFTKGEKLPQKLQEELAKEAKKTQHVYMGGVPGDTSRAAGQRVFINPRRGGEQLISLFIKHGGLSAMIGGMVAPAVDVNQDGKGDYKDMILGALGGLGAQYLFKAAMKSNEILMDPGLKELSENMPKSAAVEAFERIQTVQEFGKMLDRNIEQLKKRLAEGKISQDEFDDLVFQRKVIKDFEEQLPKDIDETETWIKVAVDEQAVRRHAENMKGLTKEAWQPHVESGVLDAAELAKRVRCLVPEGVAEHPEDVISYCKQIGQSVADVSRESQRTTLRALYDGYESYAKDMFSSGGATQDEVAELTSKLNSFYAGDLGAVMHGAFIVRQSIADRIYEIGQMLKSGMDDPELYREALELQHTDNIINAALTKSESQLGRLLGTMSRIRGMRVLKNKELLAKELSDVMPKDRAKETIFAMMDALDSTGGRRGHPFDKIAGIPDGEPSILNSLLGLRYTSMLSNPMTWVRNTVDNSVMVGINTLESAVDDVFKGDFSFGDTRAFLNGMYEGIANGRVVFEEAYRTGKSVIDPNNTKLMNTGADLNVKPRELFKGTNSKSQHIIDTIDTLHYFVANANIAKPGNVLVATDDFYKSILISGDRMRAARRMATEALGRDATEEAIQDEMKNIFRDTNGRLAKINADAKLFARRGTYTEGLTGFWGSVGSVMTNHPWTRLFVPFLRTNVNMVRQTLARIPLVSLVAEASDRAALREALDAGRLTDAARNVLARWTSGTMLMSGMAFAVYNGYAFGSMAYRGDKDKRDLMGDKPYTFMGYDFSKLGTSRMLFSVAADITELFAYAGTHEVPPDFTQKLEDVTLVAGISLANILTEPGVFEAVTNWSRLGDSNNLDVAWRETKGIASGLATSFIPNHVRAGIKLIDDKLYESRTIVDRILNDIGVHKYPAKRDILGDEMHRGQSNTHPMRNALKAAGIDVDMEEHKVESINGYKLDPDLNQEYKKYRGERIKNSAIFWQKPEKLREVYRIANGYATRKILENHPDLVNMIPELKKVKDERRRKQLENLDLLKESLLKPIED